MMCDFATTIAEEGRHYHKCRRCGVMRTSRSGRYVRQCDASAACGSYVLRTEPRTVAEQHELAKICLGCVPTEFSVCWKNGKCSTVRANRRTYLLAFSHCPEGMF